MTDCGALAHGVDRIARAMIENLLSVDFDLSQERRRHRVAVAFVGEDRHAALDAERLENGFGDTEGQTVKRTNNDDAIIAVDFSPCSIADCRNDLAENLRRNMFRSIGKYRRGIALRLQQ